jgi:hypothetical protein
MDFPELKTEFYVCTCCIFSGLDGRDESNYDDIYEQNTLTGNFPCWSNPILSQNDNFFVTCICGTVLRKENSKKGQQKIRKPSTR